MKFYQNWFGALLKDGEKDDFFKASVPGNIQLDYAEHHGFPDVNYMDTSERFRALENYPWIYKTEISYEAKAGERV